MCVWFYVGVEGDQILCEQQDWDKMMSSAKYFVILRRTIKNWIFQIYLTIVGVFSGMTHVKFFVVKCNSDQYLEDQDDAIEIINCQLTLKTVYAFVEFLYFRYRVSRWVFIFGWHQYPNHWIDNGPNTEPTPTRWGSKQHKAGADSAES